VTPEQEQDRERLRRYVVREGLVSRMNDTKWNEVIEDISNLPGYWPRFRVKCLRDTEPGPTDWSYSFPHHLPTFMFIEWLEFDPIFRRQSGAVDRGVGRDFTNEIATTLASVGVPHVVANGVIRITAYVRPGRGT
jgi:hypothetical protein